jgi:hypothetical protein
MHPTRDTKLVLLCAVLLLTAASPRPAQRDERFKTAPDNFKGVDFKNRSYPYEFSYGGKGKVALKNGE